LSNKAEIYASMKGSPLSYKADLAEATYVTYGDDEDEDIVSIHVFWEDNSDLQVIDIRVPKDAVRPRDKFIIEIRKEN